MAKKKIKVRDLKPKKDAKGGGGGYKPTGTGTSGTGTSGTGTSGTGTSGTGVS